MPRSDCPVCPPYSGRAASPKYLRDPALIQGSIPTFLSQHCTVALADAANREAWQGES